MGIDVEGELGDDADPNIVWTNGEVMVIIEGEDCSVGKAIRSGFDELATSARCGWGNRTRPKDELRNSNLCMATWRDFSTISQAVDLDWPTSRPFGSTGWIRIVMGMDRVIPGEVEMKVSSLYGSEPDRVHAHYKAYKHHHVILQ